MSANDVLQTAIASVIVIACVIWVILRLLRRRRRGNCSCCDSTTCPLKTNKKDNPSQNH